ncbi:MAG: hypothetical protein ACP5GZ_03245 [Vulcanisaeta sp.]|uniref:DOD-type homing endonuclease domain-containing protein n=1 Tax=Vulcanisaeta moutnovskia (strain 768-28) TaxID=985053 RepID=F0QYJ1_VULM7|nr:hypothetical protein [Vulcanisaeta moutnovskia]ADY01424.1 hypothetical protein VMUT_1219 [Vulcanisaeta moutnovskia 768-28]
MDAYLVGAFINECSVRWRSIEGFSDAVDYTKSLEPGITVINNTINATSKLCDEINRILQKPIRLLMFLNINDWVKLMRGLYDFYGELIDPEPELDIPNFVLSIKIPSKSFGTTLRIVLKLLGINSNVFPSSDSKLYLVIHDRDSIARFIKTIKPYLNPELNIVLRNKWNKHYADFGEPIIITKE